MTEFNIKPIGFLKSPFGTKFGVPRQSGMIRSEVSVIEICDGIPISAFEPLVVGNFIWVLFIFDQCGDNEKYHVRPPRLGGNEKIGVFATRSPFRPNNIGMSLGRIESIEILNSNVAIEITGLDLTSDTPIIDIKPYHPSADLAWSESEYWFGDGKVYDIEVEFSEQIKITNQLKRFIIDVLSKDPRPAYHDSEDRIYNIILKDHEVEFRIIANKVNVLKVVKI